MDELGIGVQTKMCFFFVHFTGSNTEWIQRVDVTVISATNQPDKIDPAL